MRAILLLLGILFAGCNSHPYSRAEAMSLLHKPLNPTPLTLEQRIKLEDNLAAAQAAFDQDPSEDNTVWLGRRLAYLGRYNEAIAVYSRGLQKFPRSAKLLRHRGHRYITLRKFDDAITDLARATELTTNLADEIEPDGSPNARRIPRSTLKSNIAYHLALAHYLKGDFQKAAAAWSSRLSLFRGNDDQIVSASYWLYLSRKRSGDHAGATAVLRDVRLDMDVIENHSYHRLLLCFKGDLKPEEVGEGADALANSTIAYGLGVRKLLQGEPAAAKADFERIIATENWTAFGYIAAEAELARTLGK